MRKLSLFGLAAFSSALLIGCGGGGGGSAPATTNGSTSVRGGATMTTATADTAIVSSSTPATYDFGGTAAVVPANHEIPAGSAVAIVGTATPVLGLQGAGAFSVNGSETGVSFTDGSLSANLALPPTTDESHEMAAEAPAEGFLIPDTRGASRGPSRGASGLTIRKRIILKFPVLPNGKAGLPVNVTGSVPVNGSTNRTVAVNVFFSTAFVGYKATLRISWTANGVPVNIAQTKSVAPSGVVNFTANSPKTIPANGVDEVSLVLAPAS